MTETFRVPFNIYGQPMKLPVQRFFKTDQSNQVLHRNSGFDWSAIFKWPCTGNRRLTSGVVHTDMHYLFQVCIDDFKLQVYGNTPIVAFGVFSKVKAEEFVITPGSGCNITSSTNNQFQVKIEPGTSPVDHQIKLELQVWFTVLIYIKKKLNYTRTWTYLFPMLPYIIALSTEAPAWFL